MTKLIKGTRTNLETIGTILRKIETRIESIEKVVGIDDYDLYPLCWNKQRAHTVSIHLDISKDRLDEDLGSHGRNEPTEQRDDHHQEHLQA